VLADIEEADAAVTAGRAEPRGVLRVALPAAFGHQHVAPLVPKFAERYPDVQPRSASRPHGEPGRGGLRPRGAHCRSRPIPRSLRELAPNRRVVCASPAYLARHGEPRTPRTC
jgi:DNA-binding transcriptional LysR family regulator